MDAAQIDTRTLVGGGLIITAALMAALQPSRSSAH
jgi:hypothetical protein